MSLLQRTTARGLRSRPSDETRRRCANSLTGFRQRRGVHLGVFEPVANAAVQTMSLVHHAGLPWYLTIPLLAVGVNFTVRLPLQYYARVLAIRRQELNPLLNAWQSVALKKDKQRWKAKRPPAGFNPADEFMRGQAENIRRIYKTWGVQRWKSFAAPLLGLVPFVVASEALRRLSTVPVGSAGAVDGLLPSGPDAAAGAFDPSLIGGGCLWFTDLTAADPYMGLSIICSVLLATNSWRGMTTERVRDLLTFNGNGQGTATTSLVRGTQRILLLVPILPLVYSYLPAAVTLYWAQNFGLSHVNDVILKRLLPPPRNDLIIASMRPRTQAYLHSKPVRQPTIMMAERSKSK